MKPPNPGAKKGTTSTRADSPPGFEGVLWPDDMDIDWSPWEPVALSEDVARELVKSLPASMVQAMADELAGGKSEVEAWRHARGKHHDRALGVKGIDWSSVPLGKLSDDEIAASLGVHKNAVRTARVARGIAPRGSDEIDWSCQPLGLEMDTVIAKRLGVTTTAVQAARTRRGIAPFAKHPPIDWDAQPLGKVSDLELARRLKVSRGTIREIRRARGIPTLRADYSFR